MAEYKKPTKQVVRIYMRDRLKSSDPPPSPDEINRRIGRDLIDMARKSKRRP